uniref:Uncharacterized protein n=1 Tax=Marseillevirus sp. TaxID=2809551 RepID=A0AA96J0N3_9VIRU|nr:hypothetical protein MarFTMF_241 [Marseillevirus sp.]
MGRRQKNGSFAQRKTGNVQKIGSFVQNGRLGGTP